MLRIGRFEQDSREVELSKQKESHDNMNGMLQEAIDAHNANVDEHSKKVDIFLQTKELHLQDEQLLTIKQQKLDKAIKDTTEIKSHLLFQSDNLAKENKGCPIQTVLFG